MRDVTHVVYAALCEKPGLVRGWRERDHDQMETNLGMLENCLDPLIDAARDLQHVTLLQGTKAYGAHLGPLAIRAKERQPNLGTPNHVSRSRLPGPRPPGGPWGHPAGTIARDPRSRQGHLASRRTAWGSVPAPRILRRPPQRSQTRTSSENTRRRSWTQGQRRETGALLERYSIRRDAIVRLGIWSGPRRSARSSRADAAHAWRRTRARRTHCAVQPPSITSSLPVTNADSSEAR
jgi:hypothetical protein